MPATTLLPPESDSTSRRQTEAAPLVRRPAATAPPRQDAIHVTHIHRCPGHGWYSIERFFADVRDALPPQIRASVEHCPRESRGFWPRVRNLLHFAGRPRGGIAHITADFHYIALLMNPRRTLLSIMDCGTIERLRGIRRAIYLLLWIHLPIRRSAMVSVISEATRRELLKYVRCPADRIRVIHCPVSPLFTPAPAAFRESCPVVLQVGTNGNKNLLRVAEALHGLECRLRIVGRLSAEQTAALARWKIQYTAVSGLSDEEMVREYQQCDLLLFASTYEGFGLPIVEAQAVGRPVVTSNLLSMPEVAGEAACLVDPLNVASIRRGVLRVMEDRAYRESLIARGFDNVTRFHPETIAAQYARLYEEIAHRAAAG